MCASRVSTGFGRWFGPRARAGLLVFVLGVAGCTHSVTIVTPKDGSYADPVTPITVEFHGDFKPGTFHATLSGTDITPLFQPPPAPGGQSSALLAPPRFMDAEHDNNTQHLIVDADFTTPTGGLGNRVTRDSSKFRPPMIQVFRGRTGFDPNLTLNERETITANVYVEKAPKERLLITVTGDPTISLNDQPAGQSIQVVIMPNDRRGDFTIRGIQTRADPFRIRGIATGFSSMPGRGVVNAGS